MHPVSFIRSAPSTLSDTPSGEAVVCASCGAVASEEGVPGSGYANPLSLDELLVRHPHATYFIEVGVHPETVVGENAYLGVRGGDVLVVDRALVPQIGSLVLSVCEGELVLCRYTEHEGDRFLICGSKDREPMRVEEGSGVEVWGVVSALSRRM